MPKYKTKIIFEIVTGKTNPRFVLHLKLPFPPYESLVISRNKGCIIRVGPFKEVLYDYGGNRFICTMHPYTLSESGDVTRAIDNLEAEGWKRVD